jgi:hypothetical protein
MRVLITCLLALAFVPAAAAATPLIVGVTEDGLKFEPDATRRDATALGLDAVRITLVWRPGKTAPDAEQRKELASATGGAGPLRIVLSVFGEKAAYAPQTATARDQYCAFLRSIVARYPAIRDVVVWNEPNKSFFWQPQFNPDGTSAAPAAYEALLARCWDELHSVRHDLNVLAPSTAPRGNDRPNARSNISHSPQRFLSELGSAYRASGRDRPIFDTLSHHVHGDSPTEPPSQRHAGGTIGEGDYGKLVATLRRAFGGTAQPAPGPIWYLEGGYQTTVDPAKAKLYTGRETAGVGIPPVGGAVNQAEQLAAALRLAACQPHVGAYFNFLLWDEARLEGWQSGLYWTDRTPKPSVPAFRAAVRASHAERPCVGRSLTPRIPKPTRTTETTTSPAETTTSAAETTGTTTTTSTRARTTTAPAEDDTGGSDAIPIAAGALAVGLLAGAAILLASRRSRRRRNSR